jgi:hypothetical protein
MSNDFKGDPNSYKNINGIRYHFDNNGNVDEVYMGVHASNDDSSGGTGGGSSNAMPDSNAWWEESKKSFVHGSNSAPPNQQNQGQDPDPLYRRHQRRNTLYGKTPEEVIAMRRKYLSEIRSRPIIANKVKAAYGDNADKFWDFLATKDSGNVQSVSMDTLIRDSKALFIKYLKDIEELAEAKAEMEAIDNAIRLSPFMTEEEKHIVDDLLKDRKYSEAEEFFNKNIEPRTKVKEDKQVEEDRKAKEVKTIAIFFNKYRDVMNQDDLNLADEVTENTDLLRLREIVGHFATRSEEYKEAIEEAKKEEEAEEAKKEEAKQTFLAELPEDIRNIANTLKDPVDFLSEDQRKEILGYIGNKDYKAAKTAFSDYFTDHTSRKLGAEIKDIFSAPDHNGKQKTLNELNSLFSVGLGNGFSAGVGQSDGGREALVKILSENMNELGSDVMKDPKYWETLFKVYGEAITPYVEFKHEFGTNRARRPNIPSEIRRQQLIDKYSRDNQPPIEEEKHPQQKSRHIPRVKARSSDSDSIDELWESIVDQWKLIGAESLLSEDGKQNKYLSDMTDSEAQDILDSLGFIEIPHVMQHGYTSKPDDKGKNNATSSDRETQHPHIDSEKEKIKDLKNESLDKIRNSLINKTAPELIKAYFGSEQGDAEAGIRSFVPKTNLGTIYDIVFRSVMPRL